MTSTTNVGNVITLPATLPKYGDAHIPASQYDAHVVGYETWARFRGWSPRVVVVWSIVTMGYVGTIVPAYYAVTSISGRPRREGMFKIGTRSRLYRDMGRMMFRRPPLEYIPLDDVVGNLYVVHVRDVDVDQFQHDLGAVRYSVVDHVVGRVGG
jgi:hypothetical protein